MLKIFRWTIAVLLSFLVLVIPRYSTAELQSIDDPDYGEGAITYDTETGLEWLDLTRTVNMTYDEVSVQIAPGGEYEGFSRPSYEELSELLWHASIELGPGGRVDIYDDPEGLDAVAEYIELLGPMQIYGDEAASGIWGSPNPVDDLVCVAEVRVWPNGNASVSTCSWAVNRALIASYNFGHYLIRMATPEARLDRLMASLAGCVQSHGTLVSLEAKLSGASQALADLNENNDGAAINKLKAFINAVEAQWGKHIPVDDAEALIAAAQGIIDTLSSQ